MTVMSRMAKLAIIVSPIAIAVGISIMLVIVYNPTLGGSSFREQQAKTMMIIILPLTITIRKNIVRKCKLLGK
jgi:hypothetical protein